MRKKKFWILLATGIAVCGISTFLYIASHPKAPNRADADAAAAMNALQFKVTKEDLTNNVEVKGKSSYEKETRVYAPFGGEIKSWQMADGAQVKKGQLLFELDATPLRSEIASLQTTLRKQKLEADLAKFKAAGPAGDTALPAGAVGEDDARTRFAAAEERKIQEQLSEVNDESIQLQLAKKQEKVEQAAFLAPEDGIFLFEDSAKIPKSVEESERIGKIVDLTKLQLVCTVGEFDVFRIKPGMPVQVKVDALKQKKLQGKVEKVSKFAKAGTEQGTAAAQFEVTISLEPDEQLIAGLSLSGTIETEKKAGAVVVPTLAVMHEKDVYYVMLQTAQGVERREIEIGMETPEKTEVLKGLQDGDTVVLQ
ncbi:efflux RND transporter periplasmic adaptor subunit [Paenibacillus sp. GCM10023248]|uniref:efflux RND transporter periplasmic adaptor subunit n=1 Tax=Bacillales TaxID=1385 RepID=UPI002379F8FB|nr:MULTISPECIES: efflux RND transporter periplasmic adaptor subunit [Bacillales]MDD9265706.1 efflux RND transporter periplasmic adaptor subunit [Paenibacillus sp. MAHUQ-63]MDR6878946.1 macrolide-specific efflux system membrane fusion protein [Bacillus sp. 3255]